MTITKSKDFEAFESNYKVTAKSKGAFEDHESIQKLVQFGV